VAWTSPRTWTAGEVPTAATFNTHVRDNFKAIGDAWTSYTPTLANWTLGNGTLTGNYIAAGKLIIGKISYTVGSTDTKSGQIQFSLPVTKVADGGFGFPLGTAELYDTSAPARNIVHAVQNSATALRLCAGDGTFVSDTSPWTWATGDEINVVFQYEAA